MRVALVLTAGNLMSPSARVSRAEIGRRWWGRRVCSGSMGVRSGQSNSQGNAAVEESGSTRFRSSAGRDAGRRPAFPLSRALHVGRRYDRFRCRAPSGRRAGCGFAAVTTRVQMKNPGAGWPRGSGSAGIADYLLFRVTSRCTWRRRRANQPSGHRRRRSRSPQARSQNPRPSPTGLRDRRPRSDPSDRRRPMCN